MTWLKKKLVLAQSKKMTIEIRIVGMTAVVQTDCCVTCGLCLNQKKPVNEKTLSSYLGMMEKLPFRDW